MADYEGVLVDLRARRMEIDKERAELDTAIAAIERLVSSGIRAQAQTEVRAVTPRAFVNLNMPQAITKYLKMAGQPQTTKQIQTALRAGGMRSGGQHFNTYVYNALHRLTNKSNGPYLRESDGRWSLRERPAIHVAVAYGNDSANEREAS